MAPPIPNRWITDPEYIELLNYLVERTKDAKSPMNMLPLAKEFKEKNGDARTVRSLTHRIERMRTRIHSFKHIDTNTKVRLIFALSGSVDANFLKELKKDAFGEVDDKKRITRYKANDGSLELKGDHSQSARVKTAQFDSKRSLRSLITSYFENKDDVGKVPRTKEEKEMKALIEFITEKCVNVDAPLSIHQLSRDFNNRFGISIRSETIATRINAYCREIQKGEFLDTHSKVKQLFGLGGRLDSDCLKELRKDAVVEVDDLNRVTKYTANDGCLTLHGDHSQSAKRKLVWIKRKKKKTAVKKHSDSVDDEDEESEHDDDQLEEDSDDEYSSEEFNSDFDSEDENGPLDETEDHTESSDEAGDFDNETPIRNCSPTDATVDDNFDFDPPTERSHTSEEIAIREDEEKENDQEITKNAGIKTRSGRLSKRRHLGSEISYNLVNSRGSATPTPTSSRPAKQRKRAIEKKQASSSSNQSRSSSRSIRRSTRHLSFPSSSTEPEENMENQEVPEVDVNPTRYHGPRIQEMDDYDWNPRENSHPESSPNDNNLEESKPPTSEEHNLNTAAQSAQSRSDADVQEPKPEKESLDLQNNQNSTPQTNGNEFVSIESHIHFLKALRPMMATLDTPTFAEDKLRIDNTIERFQSIGNEEEKIRMNEIRTCLMTCLLIVERSAKKEIVKGEDTTSFETFLSLFQSYLVLLELKELDGFIKRVKHLKNEPTVNEKKVPIKKVQFALHSIIEIIAP